MAKNKTKVTNDQVDFLLGDAVEDPQIEAAKRILFNAGYIVTKVELTTEAKTVKDLKDHFYRRFWEKYPERYQNRVDNVELDMRFASLFLESRLQFGTMGKAVALQECVDIIDTIFDYEEEFMFKYPITNISILGQGKLGWITQKAIEILNKKKTKALERKSEEMLREIENNMEIDLEEKSDKLTQMLKNVEGNND